MRSLLVVFAAPFSSGIANAQVVNGCIMSNGALKLVTDPADCSSRETPIAFSDEVRGHAAGSTAATTLPTNLPLSEAAEALKHNMIQAAISETGSKIQAAHELGIPRQSPRKTMKRLEMPDEG